MKRVLLNLVALTLMTALCHAQKVGDSEQALVKTLGNPSLTRISGDRQTWMYPDGTKIVFKDGVVVEAKIGAATPPAAPEEAVLRVEARQWHDSKTTESRIAAPEPDRPEPATKPATFRPHSSFGLLLAVVAGGLLVVCGVLIVIESFRAFVLWGLAVVIIPFGQLVLVITHLADTKKPFLLTWLVGVPIAIASLFV